MLFPEQVGTMERFAETPAQHHESIPAPTTSNSVKHNVRFDIWNNAMQVYKEHFIFGTGTGDVKDELIKQYELSGFTEGIALAVSSIINKSDSPVSNGILFFSMILCL